MMRFSRFNRLDLGKIPPRIEGVTIYSVDHNRIILDLDTFYEGDLRCRNHIMQCLKLKIL